MLYHPTPIEGACTIELERGVRYDDPKFDIDWPIKPTVVSDKDRGHRDFDPAWHLPSGQ